MRSRISSKLIFASCVGYCDRAYCGFYITSSNMLSLIEGQNLTDVELIECINMGLWGMDATVFTFAGWLTAVGGVINYQALLGESGKLLLEKGHKIWVANGGNNVWLITVSAPSSPDIVFNYSLSSLVYMVQFRSIYIVVGQGALTSHSLYTTPNKGYVLCSFL